VHDRFVGGAEPAMLGAVVAFRQVFNLLVLGRSRYTIFNASHFFSLLTPVRLVSTCRARENSRIRLYSCSARALRVGHHAARFFGVVGRQALGAVVVRICVRVLRLLCKCVNPALRCLTFPLAVNIMRLAAALRVFILAIIFLFRGRLLQSAREIIALPRARHNNAVASRGVTVEFGAAIILLKFQTLTMSLNDVVQPGVFMSSYFDNRLVNFLYQAEGAEAGSTPNALPSGDDADAIVAALACAIEAKDFRLRRHSDRVAGYALQIAEMMNLAPDERMVLQRGSILHDIGNIGIADSILLKPGGLSDWEFEEVRMHPIIGETICRSLVSLAPVIPLIRSHHEKLDGSGYPDALRGDAIPLLVRVVSVADVYDTLRSIARIAARSATTMRSIFCAKKPNVAGGKATSSICWRVSPRHRPIFLRFNLRHKKEYGRKDRTLSFYEFRSFARMAGNQRHRRLRVRHGF
jgi:HD-GYP domain-containing protein (c-di-GMP phosphodiesterase class II)